jgi:hypothetical protein
MLQIKARAVNPQDPQRANDRVSFPLGKTFGPAPPPDNGPQERC